MFPTLVAASIGIGRPASAPESLRIEPVGALVVLPAIIGCAAFAYRVFRGKVGELMCN